MPDYSLSKIYRIFVPDFPDIGIYVGGTTLSLQLRLSLHRSQFRKRPMGAGCCSSRKLFCKAEEVGKAPVIELIEAFPCEGSQQLRERERWWIDRLAGVINKNTPGRTSKEYSHTYYRDHQRKIKALNLAYYYRNREQCLARVHAYRERKREEKLREQITDASASSTPE